MLHYDEIMMMYTMSVKTLCMSRSIQQLEKAERSTRGIKKYRRLHAKIKNALWRKTHES